MKKSIYRGECQACGARQKLPQGKLAEHGYTASWGFFSGTCHKLPYEESCEYIKTCILRASGQKETLEAEKAKYRVPSRFEERVHG